LNLKLPFNLYFVKIRDPYLQKKTNSANNLYVFSSKSRLNEVKRRCAFVSRSVRGACLKLDLKGLRRDIYYTILWFRCKKFRLIWLYLNIFYVIKKISINICIYIWWPIHIFYLYSKENVLSTSVAQSQWAWNSVRRIVSTSFEYNLRPRN
jgi:hypothetical protein